MRIRRLRVANLEGISERALEFEASGVTIVQGPNEIGKSALLRAVDAIFDYPADSQARRVRSLIPVGRDVGAEIEIEIECGPYEFTYFKRFKRKPETWLRVARPRVEQLSGRQAHDRVTEILTESMDFDLWRALRVQQGVAIAPIELSESRSLMTALDQVAGTVSAGDREISLYERVHEEYLRYYTETGRDGQHLRELATKVETIEAKTRELEEMVAGLESDIDRAERLDRDLSGLARRVVEALTLAEEREREARKLDQLEAELDRRRLTLEAAESGAKVAIEAAASRTRLITEVNELKEEIEKFDRQEAELRQELEEKEAEADRRARAKEAARVRREDAERLRDVRRKDYDFRHEELDLETMSERRDRVVEIRESVAKARAILDRTKIKRAGLQRIDRQLLAVEAGKAALAAGSPSLRLEARTELQVLIDSEPKSLKPGVAFERVVPDRVQVYLPDRLEITVRAGTSLESLVQNLAAAEDELRKLCLGYGVADREDAEQQLQDREEAQRTLTESESKLQESLRDLTFEQLEEGIADLRERTGLYAPERGRTTGLPAIGADLESCRELRSAADREAAPAVSEHQIRDQEAQVALGLLQDVRTRHQGVIAGLEVQRKHNAQLETRLVTAHARATDRDLEDAQTQAQARVQEARRAWEASQEQMQAAEPARVRTLAENARVSGESLSRQQRELEQERLGLRTKLELLGERGLGEAREAARAQLKRIDREQASLKARAAAARYLFEVMRAAREAAKRRREGPLRDRINELGRILFGQRFEVELDDRLRISRRILNGTALDFDQLSTGTQEQLALIARLACAMLVDGDAGVPLIVDDALGYSDEGRLERMGAILGLASERTQVIVLTCQPARYSHVGHAKTIWLT